MEKDSSKQNNPLNTCAVILAAGKGTRMKSALHKVLHPLRGKTIIQHGLDIANASGLLTRKPVVVIGHDAEAVRGAIGQQAVCVLQEQQLGTGHALMMAQDEAELLGGQSQVICMYGDMPLLRPETIRKVIDARTRYGAAIAMLTVTVDNPRGFGRVLRNPSGQITAIIEEVDCTPEQLRSRELNVGVYCFDGEWLWNALSRIKPNPRKAEYFLTDTVELANKDGRPVVGVATDDIDETIGINTRVDLADADAAMRKRINRAHMLNGVTITDPSAVYIDADVSIGRDSVILPNTHILRGTKIGDGCVIGPNSLLDAATIGDRCEIRQSVIRESQVDEDSDVGPWSHLRNGAHVLAGGHIGNFGEVKNSTLGRGVKQGHFSYLGDATLGENVNIGAGAITCNFNGKTKNPTRIGDGAFIGSDTLLVAPVRVGDGARTGAGSVVTRDVPAGETHVGAPAKKLERK